MFPLCCRKDSCESKPGQPVKRQSTDSKPERFDTLHYLTASHITFKYVGQQTFKRCHLLGGNPPIQRKAAHHQRRSSQGKGEFTLNADGKTVFVLVLAVISMKGWLYLHCRRESHSSLKISHAGPPQRKPSTDTAERYIFIPPNTWAAVGSLQFFVIISHYYSFFYKYSYYFFNESNQYFVGDQKLFCCSCRCVSAVVAPNVCDNVPGI